MPRLAVSLSEKQYAWVESESESRNCSMAAVVRQIIDTERSGDSRNESDSESLAAKVDQIESRLNQIESARGSPTGSPDESHAVASDVTIADIVASLDASMSDVQARSLVAALEFLREHGEAQTSDIASAAMDAEPDAYADAQSWRSNLWNNVGGELQERDVVELANRARGRWRWTGM